MDHMAELLKEHWKNHPGMEVPDAVKFLYQSYMGPSHLLPNQQAAFDLLEQEWAAVDADPSAPLSEPLGNGLCRLNLRACKGMGVSANTVCRLFFLTAKQVVPAPDQFRASLDLLDLLPYPPSQIQAYREVYCAQGCPSVHHSSPYRRTHSPAYRIVWERYLPLIPLLAALDQLLSQHPQVRVALDGPCASGKSTLGEALSEIYRCPLFHMDDFFLRPEQRTPQRLAQPGGNVDYERFQAEVLTPLCAGQPVHFRPWRCREGGFGPEITVAPSPLAIVEGSYSLRPDLREHYHLGVWVEAPWPVRKKRLAMRGGSACLERFQTIWIPLEDQYFSACHVKQYCQIHICGA